MVLEHDEHWFRIRFTSDMVADGCEKRFCDDCHGCLIQHGSPEGAVIFMHEPSPGEMEFFFTPLAYGICRVIIQSEKSGERCPRPPRNIFTTSFGYDGTPSLFWPEIDPE